ncbi:formate dehydrogenase subunit delta [Roseomonas sp. BN140053]|uniref:formate dehydrogenase subunit delta n=1 Tax=Roseomonas sp. BN140053 TaxID=3391898 RepID=UPI0039ED8EB2
MSADPNHPANEAAKLVRMANQIAGFFRSYPEDAARAGIAEHVAAYWTPRMRAGMAAHLAAGGEGLDPLALRALRGAASPAESPVARETSGPEELGQLASDAG